MFQDQKNGVKGEAIGHGPSHHRIVCPILRLTSRVMDLRSNGTTNSTPLAAYLSGSSWNNVRSSDITNLLRKGASHIGADISLKPMEISAWALRAGGAMALLLGNIDSDTI
eukprot:14625986-Ditylum_brightwellii.AAC.1